MQKILQTSNNYLIKIIANTLKAKTLRKHGILIILILQSDLYASNVVSNKVEKERYSIVNKEWAAKQEQVRARRQLAKSEAKIKTKRKEEERVLRIAALTKSEKHISTQRKPRALDARRATPSRMGMIATFCMGILTCCALIAVVAASGTNTV